MVRGLWIQAFYVSSRGFVLTAAARALRRAPRRHLARRHNRKNEKRFCLDNEKVKSLSNSKTPPSWEGG